MAFLADADAHSLTTASEDAPLVRSLEAETTEASTPAHEQLAEFWEKP
jgi:hypothetical protein